MKYPFDDNFLLNSDSARTLWQSYAANMPIIDYHCHVSPKEIFEDKRFENITQLWLYGDHYKWRLMRANGVSEELITGNAGDYEKFYAFACAIERAIGNPLYHFCHLELKNYFGCEMILSSKTAKDIWEITSKKLTEPDMSVRGIIKKSNVRFIGTTDDPTDTLEFHALLAKEEGFDTVVAPTFRPDKALAIEKDGWCEYIAKLSDVSGTKIKDLQTLKDALFARMQHFALHGCRASDHGLDYAVYTRTDEKQLDRAIADALAGKAVDYSDALALKTELLIFCAEKYCSLGWVMQLHFNCLRNPNTKAFKTLGPDTGFDCIGAYKENKAVALLLDELNSRNALPRTVLYSLDGSDNEFLVSLIGAFQSDSARGKLQHGSAWWFNDNKKGMTDQLVSLANLGILGNFIGMLTDSRSFLSYARHEYFRRILCSVVGSWIDGGELPDDLDMIGALVSDICFNNANKYFSLNFGG